MFAAKKMLLKQFSRLHEQVLLVIYKVASPFKVILYSQCKYNK